MSLVGKKNKKKKKKEKVFQNKKKKVSRQKILFFNEIHIKKDFLFSHLEIREKIKKRPNPKTFFGYLVNISFLPPTSQTDCRFLAVF